MDLASELRKRRRSLGLTQIQLAQRSGLSRWSVVAYETGRELPSLPSLCRIVEALQVGSNVLLPKEATANVSL
jgi:transcriptional regulator with XRE-family HTH domain